MTIEKQKKEDLGIPGNPSEEYMKIRPDPLVYKKREGERWRKREKESVCE